MAINNNPCGGTTTTKPSPGPTPAGACCTDLECIEKPRFFCGQLLSDVDLEAAMNYIAAKNRLHNRYLFGSGVVCGLAVHCDPCDSGSIVIEPGYALDCLGNDIVVSSPTPFDVAGNLDCKKKTQQKDCTKPRIPADCLTPETEYCLVISYDEKPAKPVSALIRDNGCRTSRCEPSRTREVYRLDLIDEKTAKTLNIQPTVWSKISACFLTEAEKLQGFMTELSNIEKQTNTTDQATALNNVFNRMKEAVLDYATRTNLTHCNLIDQLCAIDARFRLAPQSRLELMGDASAMSAMKELFLLYAQLLIDCICNAFLTPCGDCCEPEYVLLACLTLRDGKIVKICNEVRTQVITGPGIRYWLQPLFDLIGGVMEYLCCTLDLTKIFSRETTFGAANAKYGQGLGAFKMARSYSTSWIQQLKTSITTIQPETQDGPLNSLNYYQRPIDEVKAKFDSMGVNTTVNRAATMEDAYAFTNLGNQAFSIPRGSNVELLVAPDNRVTGIRVIKG